jgi:hypothetical protein
MLLLALGVISSAIYIGQVTCEMVLRFVPGSMSRGSFVPCTVAGTVWGSTVAGILYGSLFMRMMSLRGFDSEMVMRRRLALYEVGNRIARET